MDLRERIDQAKDKAKQPKQKKPKNKDGKSTFNPFKYFRQSIKELRKVSWPSRQETIRGTIGVLIVTVIFVFILGGADVLFQRGLDLILPESTSVETTPSNSIPVDATQDLLDQLPDGVPPPPGLEGDIPIEEGTEAPQ